MTSYHPTPTLVQAPTEEPVSLEEAKRHCRVDDDFEDDMIGGYITAAREWFEVALDRQLVTARWSVSYPVFPGWALELPYPPLRSIVSITYKDVGLITQTLDSDVYNVITTRTPGILQLADGQSWPPTGIHPEAVTITFESGYGGAANVPRLVKHGILLLAGHWYANREPVVIGTISATLDHTLESIVSATRAYRF